MAKKKAQSASRSQEIRSYLEQNPNATPKEIVNALASRGIEVSTGLASNVKFNVQNKKKSVKKRKPGRPPGASRPAPNGSLTAEDLLQAKTFADQVGGVVAAREALQVLEQLR